MPFAGYTDFADCVAKNQDKGDPEAYCGQIQHTAEGKSADGMALTRDEVRKICPSCADKMDAAGLTTLKLPIPKQDFEVVKLDAAQRLVFGWASVAVKSGTEPLTDLQGDQIEPAELEKAAYDFVEHSRIANEMHQGEPIGQLVESFMVTPDKLEKMGLLRTHAPKAALWVGFRLRSDVFQKVQAGQLRMFSIEGTAMRVAA